MLYAPRLTRLPALTVFSTTVSAKKTKTPPSPPPKKAPDMSIDEIFTKLCEEGDPSTLFKGEGDSADAIIEAKGLKQVTDSGAIEAMLDEVLAANAEQLEQYSVTMSVPDNTWVKVDDGLEFQRVVQDDEEEKNKEQEGGGGGELEATPPLGAQLLGAQLLGGSS